MEEEEEVVLPTITGLDAVSLLGGASECACVGAGHLGAEPATSLVVCDKT